MKACGIILVVAWFCLEITSGARVLMGTLNFVYDPNSHYFSVQTTSKCYITPLSHIEREHVVSRIGLQDIELKMMREWIGVLNETIIYHEDPKLPLYFQTHCRSQDILYLHRNLPAESTFPSILG